MTKLIVAFRNFAKAPKKHYGTLPISRSSCTVSLSSRLSSRQLYHTHSSHLPAYPLTAAVPGTIKCTHSSNKTRTFTALKLRDGSLWISQKPRTVLYYKLSYLQSMKNVCVHHIQNFRGEFKTFVPQNYFRHRTEWV